MLKAGRMVMASFPRGPLCSSPFSGSQTDSEIIPISCWYGPCLSKLVLVWTGAEKDIETHLDLKSSTNPTRSSVQDRIE